MAVSPQFTEFLLDQLSGLGEVTPKRMFGGVGLYADGIFFGIVFRERVHFKVDHLNLPMYEAAGMPAFQPFEGKAGKMNYYEVPAAVLEDSAELVEWAREAVAAGRRSSIPKKKKSK